MIEALQEVVFPLFLTLGVVLRVLGAAGFGAVAGSVLKNALEREETTKYLIPVLFAAMALAFVLLGTSRDGSFGGLGVSSPGSPGTLGAFGLGAALSYFVLGRQKED
jgi:hypothetical protein